MYIFSFGSKDNLIIFIYGLKIMLGKPENNNLIINIPFCRMIYISYFNLKDKLIFLHLKILFG